MKTYAQPEIERELGPEEELIWTGRPYQGLFLLRPFDAFFIPFGVLWFGMVTAGVVAIFTSQKPAEWFPAAIFFLFFWVAGVYFVLGRFVVDARQRRRTFYGLTNQRVIIVRGLFRRELKSITLKTMSDLSLSERRDGFGTIKFGTSDLSWYMLGMEIWAPGIGGGNSLIRIPEARQVYNQVRAAQRAAA